MPKSVSFGPFEKFNHESGQQPSAKAGTSNLDAYQLYLQGRELLYRQGPYIQPALQCFERAVGLDPQYALPWSGLADARISLGFQGYEQPNAIMPQAKEAALRAVALDPMLGEGHSSLATYIFCTIGNGPRPKRNSCAHWS